MVHNKTILMLTALVASLVCLALYLPTVRYGFINFDDPEYVLNNPVIRNLSLDNLSQMFLHTHVGWWMPLTWLSLAVDYHFWGQNPLGYHLTNSVLHAVNSGLVVLIADRLLKQQEGGAGSTVVSIAPAYWYPLVLLLGGLFFGVHPLRVESVAWVTERKDVLNGLFVFLSIFFYLLSLEGRGESPPRRRAGLLFYGSVLFFVCSLMAKSVSVVLPAMLLALDRLAAGSTRSCPLGRSIVEKWPFWLASVLMAFFTIFFAAQSQYLVTYEVFPFSQRLVVSGNALWEYLRLTLFPVGLNPFNVIPDPIPVAYTIKSVLVAVLLALLFFWRKTPRLAACLCCFLLPLLPVLAFFQNGDQSFADRFTYLPSLALSLLLVLFLGAKPAMLGTPRRYRLAAVLAGCVIAIFMAMTWRQLAVWESSESFWSGIIRVQPLAIIYKERGKLYHASGRYGEAVADFSAALERITPTLKPYEYNFYAFRGESLRASGQLDAAVRDFTTAIGLHPHPTYYYHRGVTLRALGRSAEADEDFRRAGPDPGALAWFD